MLHISCPKCRSVLSLDPGFRGMMCRCSVCGSILNIPQDPSRGSVKIVQHGSSAGQPAGGSSMTGPGSTGSGSRRAESPLSDMWNGGTPRPMPVLNGGQETVQLPPDALVKMNSGSRSGNNRQLLIIGAALGAPTLIALLGIVLLIVMKTGNDQQNAVAQVLPANPPAQVVPAPAPTYTPPPVLPPATTYTPPPPAPAFAPVGLASDNPWGLQSANVMGIGVTGTTVVVYDAVEQSAPWFDTMNRLLRDGLAKQSPAQVAVVYITNGRAESTGLINPGPALSTRISDLQRNVRPIGRSGFWTGIDAAMTLRPTQIILITGRTNWASSVSTFESKLKAGTTPTPLMVINMAGSNADLEGITRRTGGRMVFQTPAQLDAWLAEAERASVARP